MSRTDCLSSVVVFIATIMGGIIAKSWILIVLAVAALVLRFFLRGDVSFAGLSELGTMNATKTYESRWRQALDWLGIIIQAIIMIAAIVAAVCRFM